MILIISDKHDVHADTVQEKLIKQNQPVYRFNLDVDSLKATHITFNEDIWTINQSGITIDSNSVQVVWFRRAFVELLLEEKDSREADFLIWKNEWNKILLGFYLSISSKPCLCPLKQSYAAENKFLQYSIAKDVGLIMPDYLTSNDKDLLIGFCHLKNSNTVLKLHHQDFYNVNGTYQGLYVNKISENQLNEFNVIGENPITLQEYIDKKYEVRYTVVGERHFCCKIDSQRSELAKIDWRRYDLPNTPHRKCDAPIEIKTKINALMKKLDINYGALDFIVDQNDNWFFLEINPMGQWLWIEDLTGLDISNAICDWLISNRNQTEEVKI